MATSNNLERIGETFKRRREQLKKSVAQAASDSGMSQTTWIAIEKGRPVRGTSYVRAAEVLDWPAETYERLLSEDGPVDSDGLSRELVRIRLLLETALDQLAQLEGRSQGDVPVVHSAS